MAPFEDLQQLWQRQPAPAARPGLDRTDAAALSRAFRRYGRRHDLLYVVKAVCIAVLLVFLLASMRQRPLAACGAALAVLSGIGFMISDWRAERAIARLNFAEPSVGFLRAAVARLHAQRDPRRRRSFLLAMCGTWLGSFVMYAAMVSPLTFPRTLFSLACSTVIVSAAGAIGLWIRRRRFEKVCRPLIVRLEAVLRTLEAEPA